MVSSVPGPRPYLLRNFRALRDGRNVLHTTTDTPAGHLNRLSYTVRHDLSKYELVLEVGVWTPDSQAL